MKNKKAALELSVTAIVILILAIVMLGLGLGFMRGMFGKVSTTIDEIASAEQEPPKPSASDEITLSRGAVILNPGQSTAVKVSVYNPTAADYTDLKPTLTCTGVSITAVVANARSIPKGEYRTYSMVFTVSSTQSATTGLCKIDAGTAGSIDFTLTVKT